MLRSLGRAALACKVLPRAARPHRLAGSCWRHPPASLRFVACGVDVAGRRAQHGESAVILCSIRIVARALVALHVLRKHASRHVVPTSQKCAFPAALKPLHAGSAWHACLFGSVSSGTGMPTSNEVQDACRVQTAGRLDIGAL